MGRADPTACVPSQVPSSSTAVQQGMPWQVMIKMSGHGGFKLILETYYAQNDDQRLISEANKIDFGLTV